MEKNHQEPSKLRDKLSIHFDLRSRFSSKLSVLSLKYFISLDIWHFQEFCAGAPKSAELLPQSAWKLITSFFCFRSQTWEAGTNKNSIRSCKCPESNSLSSPSSPSSPSSANSPSSPSSPSTLGLVKSLKRCQAGPGPCHVTFLSPVRQALSPALPSGSKKACLEPLFTFSVHDDSGSCVARWT